MGFCLRRPSLRLWGSTFPIARPRNIPRTTIHRRISPEYSAMARDLRPFCRLGTWQKSPEGPMASPPPPSSPWRIQGIPGAGRTFWVTRPFRLTEKRMHPPLDGFHAIFPVLVFSRPTFSMNDCHRSRSMDAHGFRNQKFRCWPRRTGCSMRISRMPTLMPRVTMG